MANLLVVEDDPDLAEAVCSVLEDEGHATRRARDGTEGLARTAEALPDLVLLDVEMPLLDGPGMAYEMFVRDCGQENVPVVLLSGSTHLIQAAETVGTPYFLAKPYPIQSLVKLVERALREKRAPVPLSRRQV